MAEVCEVCGMKTENPARHNSKFKSRHEALTKDREAAPVGLAAEKVEEEKKAGLGKRIRQILSR